MTAHASKLHRVESPCWSRARWLAGLTFALGWSVVVGSLDAAEPKPEPGLTVTFRAVASAEATSEAASDASQTSAVALSVVSGASPSPFLAATHFTATWEGYLNAELRGTFVFKCDVQGQFALEINGTNVWENSPMAASVSKPVQLSKGPNRFKATYSSPERGDAMVRLWWAEKGSPASPIPLSAFTHLLTPALEQGTTLRAGRGLFLEHRCGKCHLDAGPSNAVPELTMDAPSFDGIGARRNRDWMARWILDPKVFRSTARMPKLLQGANANDQAQAIAAYLASLTEGGAVRFGAADYQTRQQITNETDNAAPASDPKPLYDRLHCTGCHEAPDANPSDPTKISHRHLAEKFPPGKLAEYLRSPEAHYAWTRMPNFHLNVAEAKDLEEAIFATTPKPATIAAAASAEADLVTKGRDLVATLGCLNCHTHQLQNRFRAPRLAEAPAERWTRGCLADAPSPPSPSFGFSVAERAALRTFGPNMRGSLTRHVPAEFVERQVQELNCRACHGQLEGFPPLELLGGKLKPEWAARFIAGDIPHKIRFDAHPKGEVWLEARMPSFRSRASALAAGLAAQHGYPVSTPPEPPVQMPLAELGRKLVGKEGGFSCVSCHAVGPMPALEVFESEGINLVWAAERLLPDYYRRWFRAPTSIDPQTKMPVYFDEGKSPLTEVLEGDAEKQISAVWEYLRLGDKMRPPSLGSQ